MSFCFKPAALAAVSVLWLFAAGCSKSSGTTSKNPLTPHNAAEISASSSAAPSEPCRNAMASASFYPLKNLVAATLFHGTEGGSAPGTISGNFDFDADGKKDAVSIRFYRADETDKKSTVTIGTSSCSEMFYNIAGVYAVHVKKSDPGVLLAVVDYGMDNYVDTFIYRYDGRHLIKLGTVAGGIEPDSRAGYGIPEYNFQILADGDGRLIPRFGVMNYVSPSVYLSAYELNGAKLLPFSLHPEKELPRQFTVTMNCRPYFEKSVAGLTGTPLHFSDQDKINLSKGDKITITAVAPSIENDVCAEVRLADGRRGVLYFFLYP